MSTFADAQNVAATTSTGSLRGSTGAPAVAATTANGATGELAEDGYPKDMEIPVRYVKGMEGDVVEARRRWIATLQVCPLARHFFLLSISVQLGEQICLFMHGLGRF